MPPLATTIHRLIRPYYKIDRSRPFESYPFIYFATWCSLQLPRSSAAAFNFNCGNLYIVSWPSAVKLRSSSAPVAQAKRISTISDRIVFRISTTSLIASSSSTIQTSCLRSVSFGVRFNHTMASQSKTSVHDFVVKDARGNDVDLSVYQGKVLLIVNVASQCGLTNSNYTELSQLYEKYKNQGLEILAFPCNQFGDQEPGSNEQIMEFACTRFKAEYPIFDKVDVNGDKAASLYKFLKSSKGSLLGDGIKWNFAKFLVDKNGQVVDRYAPTTSPLSIEKDVKKLLGRAGYGNPPGR